MLIKYIIQISDFNPFLFFCLDSTYPEGNVVLLGTSFLPDFETAVDSSYTFLFWSWK